MTKKVYLKLLMVITGVLLSFSVFGQVSKTVHIETAGTLKNLITSAEKYQITDLTLTGKLNGTDILFIHDMARRSSIEISINGKLVVLNLAGANIEAGGNCYYTFDTDTYMSSTNDTDLIKYYTRANTITSYMFPNALHTITIPQSITAIVDSAYAPNGNLAVSNPFNSYSLSTINVSEQNNNFCSTDGVLYDKNKSVIIKYPQAKAVSDYSLPNSVTTIGVQSFQGCVSLTNVTIPSSVISIGDYAFSRSGLTNVIIGSSVTTIGDYAFADCTSLTNINIPTSVVSIGKCAFYKCSSLTSVTIPEGVISIGRNIFQECKDLSSLTIGNNVTTIPAGFCYGCNKLKDIVFPNNVTNIEGGAFAHCGFTNIIIPNSVTSISNRIYWPDRGFSDMGAFAYCSNLTSLTIGNKLDSIPNLTFSDCNGLTSAIIPNNVTYLAGFENCRNLTNLTIGNNVQIIGEKAFSMSKLTTVTIPNSVRRIGIESLFSAEYHCQSPSPPIAEWTKSPINGEKHPNWRHSFGTYPDNGATPKIDAKLYVPKGCASIYKSAGVWKWFTTIIEEDYTTIATINKENITIKPIPNGIVIETNEKTSISVFNLSGQKVYQSVINGNTEIRLDKGVYIVRVNNESEKVIVK